MGKHKPAAEAFEQAISPYSRRLFQAAYRLTGNKADAEDLFQELLIKLYRHMPEWLALSRPEPWFMRVLYNVYIDLHRKKARTHGINEATRHPEPDYLDELPGREPTPVALVEAAQRQRRVQSILAQLDPDQRALVTLHLMEGYTLKEVAEIMAQPLGTLKSRLHRLKVSLKQHLGLEPFVKN